MRIPFVLVLLAIAGACAHPPKSSAARPECRPELEALIGALARNYSGWEDKRKRWPEEIAEARANARARADVAETDEACTIVLETFVDAFRDRHLGVRPRSQKRQASESARGHPESGGTPRITARSDSGLVLKLPSFAADQKAGIDQLLETERLNIERSALLIVDLRGNGGGGDSSYGSLERYVLPERVSLEGVDLLASDENIVAWEFLARVSIPRDHPAQTSIQELVRKMRAHLNEKPSESVPPRGGSWMPFHEDRVHSVESVSMHPKEVVLVVDEGCISACEQLVWTFRQGKRGRIVGTRTGGALDYSNVVPFGLPSGRRHVQYATSRSRRTFRIDDAGIPPDQALDAAVLAKMTGQDLLNRLAPAQVRGPPGTN